MWTTSTAVGSSSQGMSPVGSIRKFTMDCNRQVVHQKLNTVKPSHFENSCMWGINLNSVYIFSLFLAVFCFVFLIPTSSPHPSYPKDFKKEKKYRPIYHKVHEKLQNENSFACYKHDYPIAPLLPLYRKKEKNGSKYRLLLITVTSPPKQQKLPYLDSKFSVIILVELSISVHRQKHTQKYQLHHDIIR